MDSKESVNGSDLRGRHGSVCDGGGHRVARMKFGAQERGFSCKVKTIGGGQQSLSVGTVTAAHTGGGMFTLYQAQVEGRKLRHREAQVTQQEVLDPRPGPGQRLQVLGP